MDAEQTKTGDMLSVERLRIGTHMNIIRNTIYLYDVPVFLIFQMSSETSGPHRILTSGSGAPPLTPGHSAITIRYRPTSMASF
jgi:hypothetical protein